GRRQGRLLQPARPAGERGEHRRDRELRRAVRPRAAERRGARRRGRRPVRLRPGGRRRVRARRHPRLRERVRGRRLARDRLQVRSLGGTGARRLRDAGRHRLRHRPVRPGAFRGGGGAMSRPSDRTLEQRLADGVVVGAEGYVFELERRGYVKAGPYVPEVVLDAPDALRQLHREFLRAGADVMVALTYYAHREKLRDVGRGDDLELMNRTAVRIANEVAAEGGALVAGNICNTWSYDPNDPVVS